MKLRVGGRYRTRAGWVVEIVEVNYRYDFPYLTAAKPGYCPDGWSEWGTHRSCRHLNQIVEELSSPLSVKEFEHRGVLFCVTPTEARQLAAALLDFAAQEKP